MFRSSSKTLGAWPLFFHHYFTLHSLCRRFEHLQQKEYGIPDASANESVHISQASFDSGILKIAPFSRSALSLVHVMSCT